MYERIRESKYRQEIVTFVWDFSEQLLVGDTVQSVATEVLVSSGNDPNPSDLIASAPTISGSVVSQTIRRGIPGTIYTITITGTTVGGKVIEDLCYLAILPFLGDITIPIWETTQLYPIDILDSLQGRTVFTSGRMDGYGVTESIQGYHILRDSTLTKQVKTYNIPHEDIQGYTILVSGHMVTTTSTVVYHNPHEDIQGAFLPISGHLTIQGIVYRILHEDIQGYTILTAGHLA